MARIAIILAAWNGQKFLHKTLNALMAQTMQDFFLLVIDNGSADESVSLLENELIPAFGGRARLIKNRDNLGFATACNKGILWTSEPYIVCLNQDVILTPTFLEEAVRFLDAQSDCAAIAPKLLRFTLSSDASGYHEVIFSTAIDALGIRGFRSHRFVDRGAGEEDKGQYEQSIPVFGASGAAPVYRRTALEDVRYNDEYFDEDFFSYKEDVDLAYRLQYAGWRCYYVPRVIAYHHRTAKSAGGALRAYFSKQVALRRKKPYFINYHSYKNHLLLLRKNLSFGTFFRYAPWIAAYEIGKVFFILFTQPSVLKCLPDAIRKFPRMRAKRKRISFERAAAIRQLLREK